MKQHSFISPVILFSLVLTACDAPAPTIPQIPLTKGGLSEDAPTATAMLTQPTLMPSLTATPLSKGGQRGDTPTATPRPYASAFGIDYGQPNKYAAQGEQTRLSNPTIVDTLRRRDQYVDHMGEIYQWIQRGFKPYSAGGSTIGVATTDQLMIERRLGGCHDWGLVFATIARELGYPTVMVDTASIAWAKNYMSGQRGGFVGHVFVEVFVVDKWILMDSTNNWYIDNNYDPANPVIPLKGAIAGPGAETDGFYVMRKGIDTWGYGIHSNAELTKLMQDTATQMKFDSFKYPAYTFLRFK